MAVAQCMPYGQRLTYWPMRALLLSLMGLPEDGATPEEHRRGARGLAPGRGRANRRRKRPSCWP